MTGRKKMTVAPRYRIKLTSEERSQLERLTSKASGTNGKIFMNARILLLCDVSEENKTQKKVEDIAEMFGISSRTIEHLKQRVAEHGGNMAVGIEKPERAVRAPKFGGEIEAQLIAAACSQAPDGCARWTVRLLADKMVELKIVDSISPMTVQRMLKKTSFSLTGRNTGKSRH